MKKALKALAMMTPVIILLAVTSGVALASDVSSTSTPKSDTKVLTQNKMASSKLHSAQRKASLKAKSSKQSISTSTSTTPTLLANNKNNNKRTLKSKLIKKGIKATTTPSTN